ncbi:MAG: hypothetical protein ACOX1P_28475 [Thermoguttaceae bacterium]
MPCHGDSLLRHARTGRGGCHALLARSDGRRDLAQTVDGKRLLRRCNYLTLDVEDVAELPPDRDEYSYGTVSPDHRYYAVSVRPPQGGPSQVHLLDLEANRWSVLLDKPGYHAKHEQFSRDGRNRVLIQLNQMPDVKVVLLSELEIGGTEKPFPADRPYTLRPTGHEAWIGQTSSIFFSTGWNAAAKGNVWSAKVGVDKPALVHEGKRFGHVSVSRDRLLLFFAGRDSVSEFGLFESLDRVFSFHLDD